MRIAIWCERVLAGAGAACLLWAGTTSVAALAYQRQHGGHFERAEYEPVARDASRGVIAAAIPRGTAIGRLEIPRIGLDVVVAEGDDDETLRLAAGHLPDTPLPWQEGNSALAGHRDTYFRPLRRVHRGDEIRFATLHGTFRYRVTEHRVVDPHDLSVLDASPTAALTLITCYPFTVVGAAPKRFVVRAERIGFDGA